jgi:cellulose synthase/poly-beta-1,6-N-acetylglucosamine synthase-like glycosyltransferase
VEIEYAGAGEVVRGAVGGEKLTRTGRRRRRRRRWGEGGVRISLASQYGFLLFRPLNTVFSLRNIPLYPYLLFLFNVVLFTVDI